MRALIYLVIRQLINRILSLKKKPGLLILYSFIFLMIIGSVIVLLVFGNQMDTGSLADERIIFLILAGFSLFFLYTFVLSGLSTGSSLFSMADVGHLFAAPISPKKILLYGLVSTLGKSLLGSVFIFYQVINLKTHFGYGMREICALFIIFTVMMLFCQLLAIGIYIFSNGNRARKRIVNILLYTTIAVVLCGVLLIQRQEQTGLWEAVLRTAESTWFGYIPVAGWVTMFFIGTVQSSVLSVVVPLVFFLVAGILLISLLTAGKADYYEDVLLYTEYTFQTKLAVKEGRNIPRQTAKKTNIKEEDHGIGRGSGANTLLFRHLHEMKRKSKFIFVDKYTIFMAAAMGIAAYNFRTKEAPEFAGYIVLGVSVYIQYFLTIMGKLKIELIKPYIYLIPETSLKKVLYASATSLIKPCFDGVIAFLIFAVISGTNILTGLVFALAYAASGAVFVGMTILYQRVLGGQPNLMLTAFIGIGFLMAVMAPSIGASIAAAFLLPKALNFMVMLPYAVFCLMFAGILFVTCGNLIDKTEFTGKM